MHSFSTRDKTVTFQYENAALHVSISRRSLIITPVLRSHYSKSNTFFCPFVVFNCFYVSWQSIGKKKLDMVAYLHAASYCPVLAAAKCGKKKTPVARRREKPQRLNPINAFSTCASSRLYLIMIFFFFKSTRLKFLPS